MAETPSRTGERSDGRGFVLPARLWKRERGSEPDKLHRNQPQTVPQRIGRETLGSQEWTKPFTSYLEAVLQDHRRQWWNDPYILGCVSRRLRPQALTAVLAVLRDHEDFHAVAARIRLPQTYDGSAADWLNIQMDRANALAKRLYRRG